MSIIVLESFIQSHVIHFHFQLCNPVKMKPYLVQGTREANYEKRTMKKKDSS